MEVTFYVHFYLHFFIEFWRFYCRRCRSGSARGAVRGPGSLLDRLCSRIVTSRPPYLTRSRLIAVTWFPLYFSFMWVFLFTPIYAGVHNDASQVFSWRPLIGRNKGRSRYEAVWPGSCRWHHWLGCKRALAAERSEGVKDSSTLSWSPKSCIHPRVTIGASSYSHSFLVPSAGLWHWHPEG